MTNNSTYQNILLLFAYLSVLLIYASQSYNGIMGFDDSTYVEYAHQLMEGTFFLDDGHHFRYRWGAFIPLFFSFSIFGSNDFAAALPNILVCLTTAAILLRITKNLPFLWRCAGLVLLAFNNWMLHYSSTMMVDLWVMFWKLMVVVGLYFLYFKQWKQWKAALFTAAAFAFGFMTKGNIIFILPILFYFFINDIFVKKINWKYWACLLGFTLIFFASYFSYFHYEYGNAFLRFQRIAENPYFSECSYEALPRIHTWRRIGYEFIWMGIRNYWLLSFVLFLPFLFKKSTFKTLRPATFFAVVALMYWLSSNFMPTSYKYYAPLCLDIRHYFGIITFGSIAATFGFAEFWSSGHRKMLLVQIGILVPALLLILWNESWVWRSYYYLILVLAFGGHYYFYTHEKLKKWWVMGIAIALSLSWITHIQYSRNDNYFSQKAFVKTIPEKLAENETAIVYTDFIQMQMAQFTYAYDSSQVVFRNFEDQPAMRLDSTTYDKRYLLLNGISVYYSKVKWHQAPEFVTQKDSIATLSATTDGLELWEYTIDKNEN